ncbi:unnamed protein product [Mucor hiemalis]
MYSLFNVETLFKAQNDFYNELLKQNVQDSVHFNLISREITTQDKFKVHIVPFLKYLTLNTHELLEKLSCIRTYFMAYLADEELQSIIFNYCFKVWDDGQDVYDAEIHHLLYLILENCKLSSDIWKEKLDNSNSGKKANRLEMYDNMIEDYLYNPSLNYPTNVHLDKDVNITASARFTLFNVLYAQEMKPIHFINDELFKLSDECIALIQQLDKSAFIVETKMIENALCDPKKNLSCYTMTSVKNITRIDALDTVIRECCNLLIHAPMFVHAISLALIHSLHYAKQYCTKELYHKYIMMCQAAWLKILESLLNSIVFLNPQSCTTSIVRCCACFYQFHRYTQYDDISDFNQHMDALWLDFVRKRRVYLNSTGLTDHTLPWLQYLIKTSTIVPL